MYSLKILAFTILTAFAYGCGIGMHSHTISDVKKGETIILVKSPNQEDIYSLTVKGDGAIEGKAEISLFLNSKPYKVERLSGLVNFEWESDWYSDRAEIRYRSLSAKAGRLRLQYQFHSLN